jgi:hypothetical protein
MADRADLADRANSADRAHMADRADIQSAALLWRVSPKSMFGKPDAAPFTD